MTPFVDITVIRSSELFDIRHLADGFFARTYAANLRKKIPVCVKVYNITDDPEVCWCVCVCVCVCDEIAN